MVFTDLSPTVALAAVLILTGAGVIKGTLGFGAPLVAVPLLAMLVGARSAIVLVSIPLLVTNAAILIGRPVDRVVLAHAWPVLATLIPATVVGGVFLVNANPAIVTAAVGAVTVTFAMLSWLGVSFAGAHRLGVALPLGVGTLAGLSNGSTSIPGPIFAAFLTTLQLDKRAFVWGITLLLMVSNVSQVTSYIPLGLYADGLALASAALAPALLLGQQVGVYLQTRLQAQLFNRLVLLAIGLSGANLLIRSFL